jgi:predicted N-acetyltransferase YhbS
MYRDLRVESDTERQQFCGLSLPAPLSPDSIARHQPDSQWMVLGESGQPEARCSLWWNDTPVYEAHRMGIIGHYGAGNGAAAAQLLEIACWELANHGYTMAVGPMDGNTWQRYRLLTERGSEPAFFLEPDNPDDWPGHWAEAGFAPLANYFSAANDHLDRIDPRALEITRRITEMGITLRTIDVDRFEEELRSIHALSLRSFAQNFLYTPLGEEDFVAQYRSVQPYVRPELVHIAEKAGRPVGYMFAIPDMLQARRDLTIDTVILKTMAVDPDFSGAGLGTLFFARCHQTARQLGYKRVIHALMHESNKSKKMSSQTARIFRRYTLYAKRLP